MADPVQVDGIYQGEGKWFSFLVVDEAGDPIDLSAATFTFQVKASVDDVAVVFEADTWELSGVANGVVKASLPATQTLLMTPGTYYAQLLTILQADTDVDISSMVKFFIRKPVVAA